MIDNSSISSLLDIAISYYIFVGIFVLFCWYSLTTQNINPSSGNGSPPLQKLKGTLWPPSTSNLDDFLSRYISADSVVNQHCYLSIPYQQPSLDFIYLMPQLIFTQDRNPETQCSKDFSVAYHEGNKAYIFQELVSCTSGCLTESWYSSCYEIQPCHLNFKIEDLLDRLSTQKFHITQAFDVPKFYKPIYDSMMEILNVNVQDLDYSNREVILRIYGFGFSKSSDGKTLNIEKDNTLYATMKPIKF